VLTPEYPPTIGGIAGYVAQLAEQLTLSGDCVDVFARGPATPPNHAASLRAHALSAGFDRLGRAQVSRHAATERGSVILLEFVPMGLGGFPPAFLGWLTRLPHPLWVMFHEVAYPFERGQRWRRHALALATHAQAAFLWRRADRVFLSTQAWAAMLDPLGRPRRPPEVLPIPSNVPPVAAPAEARAAVRAELSIPDAAGVVGHFGTFGSLVAEPLLALLQALSARGPEAFVLLVGRGSHEFRASLPAQLRARARSLGEVPLARAAAGIVASDVVVNPFPDGATTRRTSLMAALALGKAVVTNEGHLTERVWRAEGCVELTPTDPVRMAEAALALLADSERRNALGSRAAEVYARCFSMATTVRTLRAARAA
jgi:glycosyltransferase involved in cell wall biosynthesis